ncbi:MAG TPA: hypothetical protein VH087_09350, partial [Thermoanaerobaculia bacterium]|nr:hypothetical protein [Thermoanaerobaculia bacterium]
FLDYERRLAAARRDPNAFRQFLAAGRVGIAYVPRSHVAEWQPYFPPNEWTVVAADRAAIVLARRRKLSS